ncbi:SulP family inorganic anion transporter [Phytoactinopolyspora halotolerans]|uniref:SulP family inorganic anion transporter n=1 Tax=Phytoactinopolyspora halotolerans TaxID=1981512 RepID=A0A6L9SA97_9ACTN|nr:SulP family inorganic anion transporter [Phytoactinopolyspora halotolerans]NEE02176.1 SulP family inorganic anion transporter [Phytoactinopolyspora halotolerans]
MRLTPPARGDVIAGVSVALVLIPQSLAYAELAGLPPVHGLYAAAVAPIAGALIGSSPYLQTGPVALTSLLTLGALSPLAATGSATFVAYAAVLAVLVGAARVLLGLIRWGALAYFMSIPVVTGFTVAAAVLIVGSQVPSLLDAPADSDNPARAAFDALSGPGDWSVASMLVGVAVVAVVMGGRRISALIPWVLIVTIAALLASRAGALDIAQIGTVPSGLPPFSVDLPWEAVPDLIVPAILIALVGFAEPASIARKYAAADRQEWNPNREFIGQGLANLAAGVAGGYPAGGSFSRSALNRMTGARTRWSGAVTGATVLVVLPFAGVLSALPTAVLAGLVIVAAISLIDLKPFFTYWQYSKPQFLVAVPTFIATLLLAPRVERGLLIGIALAFVVHLWRELRVDLRTTVDDDTLYVHPEGVLYFASAPMLETQLTGLLAENPAVRRVVLDVHRLGRLDLTGLMAIRGFAEQAANFGVEVEVRDVPEHARDRAHRVLDPVCRLVATEPT